MGLFLTLFRLLNWRPFSFTSLAC
uniref:Uncharacterized protein n=1 Tax=Rhizophora mucronata TaxID=61149 RepID=A0A2P2QL60_RHIMU